MCSGREGRRGLRACGSASVTVRADFPCVTYLPKTVPQPIIYHKIMHRYVLLAVLCAVALSTGAIHRPADLAALEEVFKGFVSTSTLLEGPAGRVRSFPLCAAQG